MTIGVLTEAEIRARIGVTYCVTCKCDTLPMNDGTCGWCDHDPRTGDVPEFKEAEVARNERRRSRQAAQARYREKTR